ncbi:MAG: hypothetical protein KJ804_19085 [Proteobacteria bacterium]|nr:hypothetical protein [Pseudomonadota bacterium]
MNSLEFHKQLLLRSWLPCCCLFVLIPTHACGEEISLDASWQASANQVGEEEDVNSFNQRYGVQWNPRVTRAIFFDSNVNYSRNESTGSIIRETLSPTGSLQVENDIFLAEVSGLMNKTKNSQSYDLVDSSWEAILASNWDYRFWPNLSINVGQNWFSDSEDVHITDNSLKWSEFIAKWELDSFEAYYSYYTQLRDDFVEQSNYDEKKHFGRIDYSRGFFANRLNLSFSGQVTNSTTDISAEGDTVAIRVGLSQALAGIDPTPQSGNLPTTPGLIDGNTNSSVFTITPLEVANLAIKADFQPISTIYVYTSQLDPLLAAETSSLSWDLYSSTDGVNWQREAINPATTYDEDRSRFQVSIGGLQRIYLKLVVTGWPLSLAIPVTEIEAFNNQTSSEDTYAETQEYDRTLTDLNLRYTPSTNTSLSYSLVWDDSDYTIGNDRTRLFQTGNVRWRYNQYLIPSFTVNNTTTENSAIADNSQRSYAFTVQSIFLPTLETNVGITRNENSNDDVLESTNDSFHFNLIAALYPNLDTTLDINTIFNRNEEDDSSNENLGLRWTLTARLRPNLLVDFIAEHGSTEVGFTEIADTDQSGGRTTLNVNWRPSDLLSIMANASQGYGDEWSNYESYRLDTNFSLIRTSKTQFTIGHRITSTEDDTINSLNANWSWNISEFLTMQSIANYLITQEDNGWYVNTRLTARF